MKRIAAAFILFTRLPLWKFVDIPEKAYSTTVVFWPLTGWLTGGCTAIILYLLAMAIPMVPAVVTAIIVKLLLTGALHEDGLADFCDGFGGGRDRESILRIMKDSHIGTYGVIGLICHFILLVGLLSSLPPLLAATTILAADPFAKFCASQLTNILPYARPEGAKNRISYSRMTPWQFMLNLAFGAITLVPLGLTKPSLLLSIIFPILSLLVLTRMMKGRICGYTGDCCGATYLICEDSMIFGIIAILGICNLY
ncbi:MAG: adenosylcobinamide-GDP ribazoletransferase [Muribaculaceae bacterium]|nr:adenosylcobinamide-GDP ribazoletransferase [Muribaculaceae bacterium]MDE6786894.1 adenosylcobinamide-GDP ribazoletransferase [Muribaculaceae bacterium]